VSELTNLTDRISHLRDRRGGSAIVRAGETENPDKRTPKDSPKKRAKAKVHRPTERRFSNDYFMFFVYALLVVAVLSQFALIVWLDII